MKNHISDFFDFLFFSYWSSKNDLTVIFSSWAYFVTHIFWDIVDFINDFVHNFQLFLPTKYSQKLCLSQKMRNVLEWIFVFMSFILWFLTILKFEIIHDWKIYTDTRHFRAACYEINFRSILTGIDRQQMDYVWLNVSKNNKRLFTWLFIILITKDCKFVLCPNFDPIPNFHSCLVNWFKIYSSMKIHIW